MRSASAYGRRVTLKKPITRERPSVLGAGADVRDPGDSEAVAAPQLPHGLRARRPHPRSHVRKASRSIVGAAVWAGPPRGPAIPYPSRSSFRGGSDAEVLLHRPDRRVLDGEALPDEARRRGLLPPARERRHVSEAPRRRARGRPVRRPSGERRAAGAEGGGRRGGRQSRCRRIDRPRGARAGKLAWPAGDRLARDSAGEETCEPTGSSAVAERSPRPFRLTSGRPSPVPRANRFCRSRCS